MSLKTALHQYLASKASITALVPASRIVRGKRPVGAALPSIAYFRVTGASEHHQASAGDFATDLVQLDIWAVTDTSADAIRDAIRNVLDGMHNTTIGSGANATAILSCEIVNNTDVIEFPDDGSDAHRFCASMDCEIKYRVSVPNFT